MALSPQLSKFPTFDSVTLSTVDRFQGDEADIVIISLVIFSLIYYSLVATMDFNLSPMQTVWWLAVSRAFGCIQWFFLS